MLRILKLDKCIGRLAIFLRYDVGAPLAGAQTHRKRGTIYDIRCTIFEARGADRRVFRGVMGERRIRVLRIGADFVDQKFHKSVESMKF